MDPRSALPPANDSWADSPAGGQQDVNADRGVPFSYESLDPHSPGKDLAPKMTTAQILPGLSRETERTQKVFLVPSPYILPQELSAQVQGLDFLLLAKYTR